MARPAVLAALVALAALAGGCSKDDKTRLQGDWTITDIEFPDVPGGEKRALESLKELQVNIGSDRVTISHPHEKGRVTVYFTLGPSKAPKEIDTTEALVSFDGKNDEEKALDPVRGVYKFEGDELVLAVPVGKGRDLPRPKEFKPALVAEPSHAVLVFHLKKRK